MANVTQVNDVAPWPYVTLLSGVSLYQGNWGTRESKVDNNDGSAKMIQRQFLGQSCSIGDWCRCILCVTEKKNDPNISDNTETDEEKQPEDETNDEKETKNSKTEKGCENKDLKDNKKEKKETKTQKDKADTRDEQTKSTQGKGNKKGKDKSNSTEKKDKKKLGLFGECEPITDNEHEFWTWFIKKYLTPEKQMIENQQVAMKSKLIDLRNKVFFFFFIINAIFVTVVYVLTQVQAISIPLSCNVGDKQGAIEPISIAFTLVFGILLFVQFIGMLLHRISTISHIIATTKICGNKLETKTPIVKIEKPTLFQDDESANKSGIGVQMLTGEQKIHIKTLVDLKTTIRQKLKSIPENVKEVDLIVSRYSNVPVHITSVRDPVWRPKTEMNNVDVSSSDTPGPSST